MYDDDNWLDSLALIWVFLMTCVAFVATVILGVAALTWVWNTLGALIFWLVIGLMCGTLTVLSFARLSRPSSE